MFLTGGNLAPGFQTRHLIISSYEKRRRKGTLTKKRWEDGEKKSSFRIQIRAFGIGRIVSHARFKGVMDDASSSSRMSSSVPVAPSRAGPMRRPPSARPITAASNPQNGYIIAIYENRGQGEL